MENVQQSYDTAAVQRIHWQRCLGRKSGTGYDSTYGITTTTAGTTATLTNAGTAATNGMGDSGAQVHAPGGSGVMFVEINYLTEPLFGTWLTTPRASITSRRLSSATGATSVRSTIRRRPRPG